ncbi:MAG TPA: di-heme oxidoredictase family protein [Gemmatimonadaceae bacterium]
MRRPTPPLGALWFAIIAAAACGEPVQAPKAVAPPESPSLVSRTPSRIDPDALSGGATTVFDVSAEAFEQPAPNLDAAGLARHDAGDEGFGEVFVAKTGLGPLFNNSSCEACHVGDGRGRPPLPGESFQTMLFRASIPGTDPHGGPNPAGLFGGQLQLEAVAGYFPEASARVTYDDSSGRFDDGTRYTLRVPKYSFRGLIGALPSNLLTSPRVAPVNFGLGLLEAIPEATIRAHADPNDSDRDGISGRVNIVYDETIRDYIVGRFGWKANVGTLLHQAAGAYNGDMGVTTSFFPNENCEGAFPGCRDHAPEVDNKTVADVAFYTQTLGVPARRDIDDPQTRRGESLFRTIGCDGCHLPTVTTGVLAGVPAVSNQRIHPYTDLLLHDMGDALADNRPDFRATGREYRTPPLWGIGLVGVVNGHTFFMHDGRARNLQEAVLWHGGEGRNSRERFKSLAADDRKALIAFLNSL